MYKLFLNCNTKNSLSCIFHVVVVNALEKLLENGGMSVIFNEMERMLGDVGPDDISYFLGWIRMMTEQQLLAHHLIDEQESSDDEDADSRNSTDDKDEYYGPPSKRLRSNKKI
jgi:hypothetical protein